MVAWLLQNTSAGDDVCSRNNNGDTPLHFAVLRGNLSIAKWLRNCFIGVLDVQTPNNNGTTPLHYACKNGNLSVCEWLVDVGAASDIRRLNDAGDTPMLYASRNGHLAICKWLWNLGAEQDTRTANYRNSTPIRSAHRRGHSHVVRWLIQVGAAEVNFREDEHLLANINEDPASDTTTRSSLSMKIDDSISSAPARSSMWLCDPWCTFFQCDSDGT